ncbi:ferritin-like domain-containing protein [Pseudoflavitalea rhizosphaerae]|uniref:YciE/YciF ferroxidase family protein n=1 Tax=Pseudoflavitalea rhizosphaerae TaxID=1884793 RepID=UPI00240875AA|nr:DUF892 family protein [Pseudoflavitalea rhizosphaerae]
MEKKKTSRSSASSNGRQKQSNVTRASKNGKSGSKASSRSYSQSDVAEAGMDEMLEKLFTDQLKDIYYAEKLLTRALPKMAKAATTEELKEAILQHQEETETHVERLEQVFEILGKRAQSKKCEAMDGLKRKLIPLLKRPKPVPLRAM